MGARCEQRGQVAVITVDKPPVNGLGLSTRQELAAGVEPAVAKPNLRSLIKLLEDTLARGRGDQRQLHGR